MSQHLHPKTQAVSSGVSRQDGHGGLSKLVLTHPSGSTAEVYLHGAHVTSWCDAAGRNALWVSRRSRWDSSATIRGGIPVVFPQFAELGPLPKHGFARTAEWETGDSGSDDGAVWVQLRLGDNEATRALWPHRFEAELRVELSGSLRVALEVVNTGNAPFEFTAALHSYFHIADVDEVVVSGLEGIRYRDKTRYGAESVQENSALRIRGETDRVYAYAPDELQVRDASGGILLRKRGFPDAVVWNPGPQLAQKLDDFADDEFRTMVCVEAACVEQPVRLTPGQRWTGEQVLSHLPAS